MNVSTSDAASDITRAFRAPRELYDEGISAIDRQSEETIFVQR